MNNSKRTQMVSFRKNQDMTNECTRKTLACSSSKANEYNISIQLNKATQTTPLKINNDSKLPTGSVYQKFF